MVSMNKLSLKNIFGILSLVVCLYVNTLQATYILRHSTTDNGGIAFTGNTLGLSKVPGQNNAGTSDAAGAFITTESPLPSPVGTYVNDGSAGTTLDYRHNSSTAVLDLPANSVVLYAELIWSGSYDYFSQITGNEPDGPVKLITPQGNSFSIMADPATKQNAITPSYGCPGPTPTPCNCPCGNYVRSCEVTSIVQAAGAGTYTVGSIPGTIAAGDDTHNAAGWTLAVIYQNPGMLTYNMTLFVGCEQASYTTNQPATVAGFCVPPIGTVNGRLFISATEADANKTGDTMLFGNTLPLTSANAQSGDNNPTNNFFASQLNTKLVLITDPVSGKLIPTGSSQLDTRGSYGDKNPNPSTATNIVGGRQGYDITSIDVSSTLVNNQTVAYALGTTTGDDYTINALAMQIQVGAPIIVASKKVNGQINIDSAVGNTVTFSIELTNIGSIDASDVVFQDPLETGLSFVSGSFKFNNVTQSDPNLSTGFSIGTLAVQGTATIEFQATIESYPQVGNTYYNSGSVDYNFQPCQGNVVPLNTDTNIVSINLYQCEELPPSCFTGCLKKCGKQSYLFVRWGKAPSPCVIAYRIYDGENLVADVPAITNVYQFATIAGMDIYNLRIVSVYPGYEESDPTYIDLDCNPDCRS